ALGGVLGDRGALAVTTGGGHQQEFTVADHAHGQQLVVLAEAHALDTGGGTAHGAQLLIVGGEADGLAVLGGEQDVIAVVDQGGTDEAVAVIEVDGDQAGGAGGFVVGETGLLHATLGGGQDQVGGVLVGLDLDDLGDALLRLEFQQVGHVLATGGAGGLGQFIGLEAVD